MRESLLHVIQRPVVGRPMAGGYGSAPARKTAWGWALAGAGVLIAFVVVGYMMMGMVDDVTFQLPTEQAITGRYPEATYNEGQFKGIWGEADRGTWIYE